jgi:soluble lytic murein transglycosylase
VLGTGVAAPVAAQTPEAPVRTPAASLVFAARAFDRANSLDSARSAYETAAALLPTISDWLWLRAAGVTADTGTRARDYASVHTEVARSRIPWTEALARERTGDFAGAARAYDSLGLHAEALHARAASSDTSGHFALCSDIEQFALAHTGGPDARSALDIGDRICAPLPLDIERVAAVSAAPARAVAAFVRLDSAGPLTPTERFGYAMALERLHRTADAVKQFTRVTTPAALAHPAMYQRGRTLVAGGDKTGARAVLRRLVAAAPKDTSAGNALALLADLATDDGNDAGARAAYLAIADRFPTSAMASKARFRLGLIAFVAGRYRAAARAWDGLAITPHAEDAIAAKYWAARAWAAAGDTGAARIRWRAIIAGEPLSYYAGLSGLRLDGRPPVPTLGADTTPPPVGAATDSALGRSALLTELGMDVEAKFETDRVARTTVGTYTDLLATGTALARAGDASRGIAFGWRLLARGDSARTDTRVYRLIFPLRYGDKITADARAASLDPALVAAVIRQESNFTANAASPVGARGLMQIMPGIGRDLARSHNVAGPWDPAVLDQPDVNISLGVAHFATFLEQEHGIVVRGLAAYNAGPSRVTLWSVRKGTNDPEVFVERIPFTETRDYVRAIMRGRDLYAALYHL